ncbi:efflux RND transporter periplasmic adaptor subunit [Neptuniibacter sp. QD48_55]|uniref:efflux RND transporter periplasmic adaptor subunit n=1 Tax=Neptuniibacter sp. QD48_55 TaxID=3398212 RepID=UPI0039F4B62C
MFPTPLRTFSRNKAASALLTILFLIPTLAHAKAMPVRVETAIAEPFEETLTLHGTLKAELSANLSLAAEGIVKNLSVDIGSQVNQDDLILSLDDEITRQNLLKSKAQTTSAQTQLNEAYRQLKEGELLRKKKHIAQNKLISLRVARDVARSDLAAAKAEQERFQHELGQHQLLAPFAGIITAKQTEKGEWLSSGNPAVTLVSLDKILLDVQIPQAYFSRMQEITTITIYPDTAPNTAIEGLVKTVVPVGSQQSRTFLTRFKPVQANPLLLPGTSAKLELNFAKEQNVVMVSRDAILHHADDGNSVFIVVDGKAERRPVALGKIKGDKIQIIKGINANDQVVIRGNELLREGAEVTLQP